MNNDTLTEAASLRLCTEDIPGQTGGPSLQPLPMACGAETGGGCLGARGPQRQAGGGAAGEGLTNLLVYGSSLLFQG